MDESRKQATDGMLQQVLSSAVDERLKVRFGATAPPSAVELLAAARAVELTR